MNTPARASGGRAPNRATSTPESGAQTVAATAIGSVTTPTAIGVSPRACCRYRVLSSKAAPNATNTDTAPTAATANGGRRNSRGSTSGSAIRDSTQPNAAVATATARDPAVATGEPHRV